MKYVLISLFIAYVCFVLIYTNYQNVPLTSDVVYTIVFCISLFGFVVLFYITTEKYLSKRT